MKSSGNALQHPMIPDRLAGYKSQLANRDRGAPTFLSAPHCGPTAIGGWVESLPLKDVIIHLPNHFAIGRNCFAKLLWRLEATTDGDAVVRSGIDWQLCLAFEAPPAKDAFDAAQTPKVVDELGGVR